MSDAWIDQILADIPAADARARLKRLAALEFAIHCRLMGPCPDVWRNPPAGAGYWFRIFAEKLVALAMNTEELGRELAAAAESSVKDGRPNPVTMVIAWAAFQFHDNPERTYGDNVREAARMLDVDPGVLGWLLAYIDRFLDSRRYGDGELHRLWESLHVLAKCLMDESGKAVLHRVVKAPPLPPDPASLA